MNTSLLRCAAAGLAAALLAPAPPAASQQAVLDRVEGFMEWVSEGLETVGQGSERFIGPGLDAEDPPPGAFESVTREFNSGRPVSPGATVSIQNRFGQIYVQSWSDSVVKVEAGIHVRAATLASASEIAEAIEIQIEGPERDRLSIRTALPDFRGNPPYEVSVDYVITVPARTHIECENHWADTIIRDIRGEVSVRSRSGVVDLQRIEGPVRVWAEGEFPLQVRHVERGGTFDMRDAQAEFSHVAGKIEIANYMGRVTIRDLPAETEMNVESTRGPVEIHLSGGADPDLVVNVLDGEVRSDVPLQRRRQGGLLEASRAVASAAQRVSVRTWFGDVRIRRQGVERPGGARDPVNAVPVEDSVERSLETPAGARLRIQAMAGDIRVEGVDSDTVTVRAVRRIRLPSRAGAPEALESLLVRLEPTEDGALLQTVPSEQTAALEASYYRVDLVVSCPRDVRLRVDAADGITDISGLGGPVAVNQQQGRVTAAHVKGELRLHAVKGDIAVSQCGGPVDVMTGSGRITTAGVLLGQRLKSVGGGIVVKEPGGDVVAGCAGGDVTLTALDGVAGDYEAHVTDGSVRLLLPGSADARLYLTVKSGDIQSPANVPLVGSLEGELRHFQGRLKGEGRYSIEVEVERGDVEIDTFEPEGAAP